MLSESARTSKIDPLPGKQLEPKTRRGGETVVPSLPLRLGKALDGCVGGCCQIDNTSSALLGAKKRRDGGHRDMAAALEARKAARASLDAQVAAEAAAQTLMHEPAADGNQRAAPTTTVDKSPGAVAYEAWRALQSLHEVVLLLAEPLLERNSLSNTSSSFQQVIASRVDEFLLLHSEMCGCKFHADKFVSERTVHLIHNDQKYDMKLPTFQCSAACPLALLGGKTNGKLELPLLAIGFFPASPTCPQTAFSFPMLLHFLAMQHKGDISTSGAWAVAYAALLICYSQTTPHPSHAHSLCCCQPQGIRH
jgi:hypothetical protein